MLFITLNHSLEALVEEEKSTHMDTNINVAMNEYSHEFKEIKQFADNMVYGKYFINNFKKENYSNLQESLLTKIIERNMDFAVVMDTDHTVLVTTSDGFSIRSAATSKLIDDALHGKSISSEEIITLSNPAAENMAQMYLTPIYVNTTINGIIITGRVLNNKTSITQQIDSILGDTTTAIYQKGYSTSITSNTLSSAQFPVDIVQDVFQDEIVISEVQRSSITYVYAATPITNYNGDVIGTLVIETPKSAFTQPLSQFNQTVMFAGFAGLLFGLIFMVTRVKEITRPLLELKKATQIVAEGKGYEKISNPGTDEIGDVARSFNDMVDSLEDRSLMVMQSTEEVMSANVELNEYRAVLQEKTAILEAQQYRMAAYTDILTVLSSTVDLNTILTKGLDSIMTYSKSPAGVIYLYNTEKKILSPAITKNTLKEVCKYEFAQGEGIPGLCALNKEKMIVTELDKDTIFRIEAGLCEFTPTAILSIPLIFRDTVLGVIVTCHTDEITDDITQFMQQTADQLAVSINNAQSYRQIEQMRVQGKDNHAKPGITSKEVLL